MQRLLHYSGRVKYSKVVVSRREPSAGRLRCIRQQCIDPMDVGRASVAPELPVEINLISRRSFRSCAFFNFRDRYDLTRSHVLPLVEKEDAHSSSSNQLASLGDLGSERLLGEAIV